MSKEWKITYGQKSVDGGSKWRAGKRESEVRLDGWCEGGHMQQRNDGGGCASMRERSKRVESPGRYSMLLSEFRAAIFVWPYVLSDCLPVLWWLSPGERWDAVP